MKKGLLIYFITIFTIMVNNVQGATFTVTSVTGNAYSCSPNATNTNVCLAAGTLGWAITSANANAGADVIDFNLPSGSIIDVTNPNWLLITDGNLTIDATINNMATAWTSAGSCKPIIQIDAPYANGFDVNGVSGVTIKGLVFNMQGNCVTFRGAGVTSGAVYGCYAGLNIAGTAANSNIAAEAISIESGASGVIVGGNSCSLRNVFLSSGNGGVYFDNGDNCIVRGNYFNTNAAGLAFISPGSAQAAIRLTNGSTNNLLENNIVTINSGQCGIFIQGASNSPTLKNNYVGFNTTGVTTIPNAPPTYHSATHGMIIDGTASGRIENCVVGNFNQDGIHFQGAGCDNWTIVGCKIGTDISGTLDKGNKERGIFVNDAATNHTIGGSTVAERNIVSGNGGTTNAQGIMYSTGCTTCRFENNYVGVDVTGNACLPNGNSGFFLQNGVTSCTIINNVVGCNGYGGTGGSIHGIQFYGTATGNTITQNRVGLGVNGTTNLGNNQDGISFNGSSTATISYNIIAHNQWGIFTQGGGGSHIIIGNTIFTNGDTPVPGGFGFARFTSNEGGGICAQTGNNNNQIGRANAGEGNTLYDNLVGIHIRADAGGSTGNTIYNNTIYGSRLGNYSKFATDYSGTGITVSGSNSQKIGGTGALQPNFIYNNQSRGVLVHSSDFVEIRRNSIYCNGSNATEKSTPNFAIYLISANGGITKPGPITYVAPNGIANNAGITTPITPNNITAGDVIEVYYDDQCGCQLKTYLGDGNVASAPDWSYAAGGNPTPIPANGYCQIGGTKADGSPCTSAGLTSGYILTSVTATRTTSPGTASARTSEPMDCSPTVLPVNMVSFTAKRNGTNSAILNWTTASERNNAYFEVLRSTDAKSFVVIGVVSGSGTTALLNNYSFKDEALQTGTYYYMLNQVDLDGTSQLSQIRAVSLSDDMGFDVVPTAVAAGENIRILNFTGEEISSLSVIDMSGKIYQNLFHLEGSVQELNTNGFASGIYMIKIISGDKVVSRKVVIY